MRTGVLGPSILRRILFAALVLWTMRLVVLGFLYANGAEGTRRHHIESGVALLVGVGAIVVVSFRFRRQQSPGTPLPQQLLTPRAPALGILLLLQIGVALWILSPGLRVGLLSDDYVLFEHAMRGGFAPAGWHFRPLPLVIWWVLSKVTAAPWVFMHLINVVLHGVNALLVWRIARRLGMSGQAAVLAGMFFVVYPAATESVVWCSGIQDVLMTTATLLFVTVWTAPWCVALRVGLMLASLVAGFATKETAVAMPALGIVTAWPLDASRRRENLLLAVVFGALAGLFALWSLGLHDTQLLPVSKYAVQTLVFRAFAVLFAPWSAALLAVAPWLLALSIGGMSVLLLVSFARWTDTSAWGWCAALQQAVWVLLAIAPTWGFFLVLPDLQGARYTYLAAAAAAMLLANMLSTAVGQGRHSRSLLWVVSLVLLAVSNSALRFHVRPWKDAALQRDVILNAAARAAENQECASLSFGGLPDHRNGAFVFLNGFAAALRQTAPEVAARLVPYEQAACRFELVGQEFRKRPSRRSDAEPESPPTSPAGGP